LKTESQNIQNIGLDKEVYKNELDIDKKNRDRIFQTRVASDNV